jgi:hypothetical protein
MTAKIITLDDFRRNEAGPAKIPTSKYEHHSHTLLRSPFVTLPDPLPKDWGEFWKVSDFWSLPSPFVTLPDPLPKDWSEFCEVSDFWSLPSPFVTLPDPLPKNWGEFWKVSDFWRRQQATATCPSPESWRRALISLQSQGSTFVP